MTTLRTASTLLLLAGAACAGAPSRPASPEPRAARTTARTSAQPTASAAGSAAPAPAPAPDALSGRAQRLFGEAVQAQEEQRKLKVPTDWPLLERKWRAVVDASEVAEARHNLGVALERQGRVDDARAEYERALSAKPGLRQSAVNLAVLLEKAGDARGAAAAYAAIVRDFPEDALARERLAALYRASGQLDEAWRLSREALLRDPRSVGAYKVMVRVALQRNDLDLAKLIAFRAQKLDPADPELPFFVGQVLARQGDEPAATAQFKKALAQDERFLPARHALLEAAVKKRSWTAVAEQAQAILKEEPGDAPVHLANGIALRHLDQADAALAAYAKAEQLGGAKLPEVHLARGVLYMRVKNECEPALEEFRAYARAAGPMATSESPVLKLQRECEQVLSENRRAVEAAKAMQAEAARKAAEQPARNSASLPAGGGVAPTSAPSPSR